jgi:hypothetical protein
MEGLELSHASKLKKKRRLSRVRPMILTQRSANHSYLLVILPKSPN